MSLVSRITVTPLLYACGALLAAVVSLSVYATVLKADVRTAQAATTTVTAERDSGRTERAAWKTRAAEMTAANAAYGEVVTTLRAELATAQGETRRIDAAAQRAVAAAQADARDADRTLAKFTAQFQAQSRKPLCAQAMTAMEAACPAYSGY